MREIVETTTVHIGRRMSFKTDRVRDGKKEFIIDYVDSRRGAVAIIGVTKAGKIVLERNRRHPVGNREVIEIPAGHLEELENPLECARRETEEETGYQIKSIKQIGWAYTTPGHSNEVIYLFFAQLGPKGKSSLESTEDIRIFEATKEEVLELIKEGELNDMKSIAGILKAKVLGLL